MAPPPPPLLSACQSCATGDAIVFCLLCGAGLCLLCDHALHAAAAVHPRAPLCDACHAAPAALRYHDAGLTMCAGCAAASPAAGSTSSVVTPYTGCPAPADLLRLVSAEAPQPQQEFEVWLAQKLLLLGETEEEQGWDVAEETAKLEKMLEECTSPALQPFPAFCTMPRDDDDAKKREERERAKLRYNDKKKKRRFCKQVLYASRKARADTRERIKGRFAKASTSNKHPAGPIHDDPSTTEAV